MAASNVLQRCRRHTPALLLPPPPRPWARWRYGLADWHLISRCIVCGAVGRQDGEGRIRWYAAHSRTATSRLQEAATYQPQPRPLQPPRGDGVLLKAMQQLWDMDKAWEAGRDNHPQDASAQEDRTSRFIPNWTNRKSMCDQTE